MPAGVNAGDTAWILMATALVLMMTPALGLFYAGLVRAKNTLNTFMMCVAALAIATITWALIGYSFAFSEGNGLIGGFDHAGLAGVAFEPREGTTIPHLLFMAFQATFCILTTALVAGAVVERMRFGPFLIFAALWSVLVYAVMAHWVWGGGWLQSQGTLDFAGGVPVEMASGFSALAAALVVGARKDYGRQAILPHNSVYVLLGAGLLWFGWFGFNGGSGLSTGNASVLAFTNTLLTPACALATWFVLDLIRSRQVTAIGAATAIIVGCVGITPGGRLHQPDLGDGARRRRRAARLRRDRVAHAHARGRDARRARRARRRRLHRDPLHRRVRAGVVERRRRRRALRRPRAARRAGAGGDRGARLRVRRDVRAAQADRARDAAARAPTPRRRSAWTSSATARRPTPPARARSSSTQDPAIRRSRRRRSGQVLA